MLKSVELPRADQAAVDAIPQLLVAYRHVLANAETERMRLRRLSAHLPWLPLPWVPSLSTRPRALLGTRPPKLLRPSWLIRFFVRMHVARALDQLQRTLSLRYATGLATEGEDDARERVEAFSAGLRPVRAKTALAFLIVAVLLLGRLAVTEAPRVIDRVPTIQLVNEITDKKVTFNFTGVRSLADRVADKISLDPKSTGDVIDALVHARVADIALLLVAFSLAAYVVLRPLSPAFRLARVLLNLDTDYVEWRSRTTARWHVPRSTGLYGREREIFGGLGAVPPTEPPLDLLTHALVLSAPLALAVQLVSTHDSSSFFSQYPIAVYSGSASLVALAAVRAYWLMRTWRRRQGVPQLWGPIEASLEDGARVKVRDPLTSAAFSQWLPHYIWIWWWMFQDELHALSRSRGLPDTRTGPRMHGLALSPALRWLPFPAMASWCITARQRKTVLGSGAFSWRSLLATLIAGVALVAANRLNLFSVANVLSRQLPWPLSELVVLVGISVLLVRGGRVAGERGWISFVKTVAVVAVFAIINFYGFNGGPLFNWLGLTLLVSVLFSPAWVFVAQRALNTAICDDDRAVIEPEGPGCGFGLVSRRAVAAPPPDKHVQR